MKKKELTARIEEAIERCKKVRLVLGESDNPQIMELCKRAEAKQEAFEIVLLAMRGNSVSLDIEAS